MITRTSYSVKLAPLNFQDFRTISSNISGNEVALKTWLDVNGETALALEERPSKWTYCWLVILLFIAIQIFNQSETKRYELLNQSSFVNIEYYFSVLGFPFAVRMSNNLI